MKQTSSPNSNECSTLESNQFLKAQTAIFFRLAAVAAVVAFSSVSFLPNAAQGAVSAKKPVSRDLASVLLQDIHSIQSGPFDRQFTEWENRYGASAVAPLTKIVGDARLDDTKRYVALMGIARLGGPEAAPILVPALKDRSWLLRSGALKAISALGNPSVATAILPLVEDKALVVRAEAIDAIVRLRPNGSVQALTRALASENNFRNGKALWVPRRALEALTKLGAREAVPAIQALLSHDQDPELQASAIRSLEELTGKTLEPGGTLVAKVAAWKAAPAGR